MRILPFLLLAACSSSPGQAPPPPAAALPAPKASTSLSAPGLTFDSATWHGSDGSEGTVWRTRIDAAALTVLPSANKQPFSTFQQGLEHESYILANGGFYNDLGKAMSLVVHNGEQHTPLGSGSGVVTGPTPVRVVHKDDYVPGATEALQSIDRVVDNAENLVTQQPSARRAARTVLVVDGDTVWIAMFADQSSIQQTETGVRFTNTGWVGPTLFEAAEYVRTELNAKQALNLDGAVSSHFIVHTPDAEFVAQGQQDIINAVVLHPTQAE